MRRTALIITFATLSSTAFAHPGHVAEIVAGHSHLPAIAGLATIAVAIAVAFKKRLFS